MTQDIVLRQNCSVSTPAMLLRERVELTVLGVIAVLVAELVCLLSLRVKPFYVLVHPCSAPSVVFLLNALLNNLLCTRQWYLPPDWPVAGGKVGVKERRACASIQHDR
eukprot:6465725-Amphidinium_carterae.2